MHSADADLPDEILNLTYFCPKFIFV